MGIALWIAAWIALWFFYKFCMSMMKPYAGRHQFGNIQEVPQTYHPNDSAWIPAPVRNRAWWNARMTRLRKVPYLFIPLGDLWDRKEDQYRQFTEWLGSNYRWLEVPFQSWPDSWKEPVAQIFHIAGSDVPSRSTEMRMAA